VGWQLKIRSATISQKVFFLYIVFAASLPLLIGVGFARASQKRGPRSRGSHDTCEEHVNLCFTSTRMFKYILGASIFGPDKKESGRWDMNPAEYIWDIRKTAKNLLFRFVLHSKHFSNHDDREFARLFC
jgi:hypothetical protein